MAAAAGGGGGGNKKNWFNLNENTVRAEYERRANGLQGINRNNLQREIEGNLLVAAAEKAHIPLPQGNRNTRRKAALNLRDKDWAARRAARAAAAPRRNHNNNTENDMKVFFSENPDFLTYYNLLCRMYGKGIGHQQFLKQYGQLIKSKQYKSQIPNSNRRRNGGSRRTRRRRSQRRRTIKNRK